MIRLAPPRCRPSLIAPPSSEHSFLRLKAARSGHSSSPPRFGRNVPNVVRSEAHFTILFIPSIWHRRWRRASARSPDALSKRSLGAQEAGPMRRWSWLWLASDEATGNHFSAL